MKQQSLSGIWQYRVGKGEWQERAVPFSALAVGHSECMRRFDLAENADKVLLRFDGINYAATVTLNGQAVGDMKAYAEYTFDVTDLVKPQDNLLLVELEDLSPLFGPTTGWENFGGITRDVSLLYADRSHIKDVFFHTKLKNNYTDADYTVELTLSEEADGDCRVTLSHDGVAVDCCTVPVSSQTITRSVEHVRLWSPDTPNLYELKVELLRGETVTDIYTTQVGFREFTCDRHRFLLNGKHIFLQGVCRHEMVGDCGHTVPEELIERDLRMIKETGCNYVRLVHYPQSKKVAEIADRIGLMVSEEPGLWWADTANPEVADGALEVMGRTVLRDRNRPSIVFWLCFNECKFTEQYLKDSARVCREADPTRLVSGANCMNDEDTYHFFNLCGFDFYTMHPYANSPKRGIRSATVLFDKPLLFTEWGGYYATLEPSAIPWFIDSYYQLYLANSDEGALAGASFWYWAEVGDYHRVDGACQDGIMKEALVDKNRTPLPTYDAFVEGWQNAKSGKRAPFVFQGYREKYGYAAEDSVEGLSPLTCQSPAGIDSHREAFTQIHPTHLDVRHSVRGRYCALGPVLQQEEAPGLAKEPYVLSEESPVIFEGEGHTSLTLIGCVSAPGGYPLSGEYGETAAELTVTYTDGSEETFPLRNGIEFTTVFTSTGSSRIDPRAEKATPFARFHYDQRIENFLINRMDLPLAEGKTLCRATLRSLSGEHTLLFYGAYSM